MKNYEANLKNTVLITLIILTLAFSAEAKILYVDGSNGNDATNYTINDATHPWQTIGRAAWGSTNRDAPNTNEAARPGDTVIIHAGTYTTTGGNNRWAVAYNPINTGTPGNQITFQANGTVILTYSSGSGPMIGASQYIVGNHQRNYITWKGFTIDEANAPTEADTGMATLVDSTGSTLEDNILIGIPNMVRGDNYNAIRVERTTGSVIRNNLIRNIYGSFGRNHAGIMSYYSGNLLIENNEIIGSRNVAQPTYSGSGIYLKADFPNTGYITIRKNIITDHHFAAIGIHREPGTPSTPIRIYENIIANSSEGIGINAFDCGATDPRNVKVVNNIFINNDAAIHMNNCIMSDAYHVFWNNIIYGGSVGIDHANNNPPALLDKARFDSEHNVVFNTGIFAVVTAQNRDFATWKSTYGQDSAAPATVTTNPMFVNAASGDYRLQPGSPALNLGVDILDLDGDGNTNDLISAGVYVNGDEVIGRTTTATAPGPDTTPPTRTNAAPTGNLSAGTTQTTISLTTNEAATCRYMTSSGVAYASMTNTFTTTGSTSHSRLISGLTNGQTYNYYIRCIDTANTPNANTNDYTITFAVAAPDPTPPTVSITSPSNSATVSGTITISATANDNIGVSGVQFRVDGTDVGSEDTSAPYSLSWNSASASNGSHSITAVARDAAGNTATSTSVNINVQNTPIISVDTVWFDDSLPAGADSWATNDAWNWVSSNPAPYSGSSAHQANIFTGLHSHQFQDANPFNISTGEIIFTYIYLDPANPPTEIMLKFQNMGRLTDHRAYWGANTINEGTDGTNSRRYMGPLPATGQWVRLEIPASQVGLENNQLKGMYFMLYNGRATWDKTGKSSTPADSTPPVLSSGSPTGSLAAGTTQTTVSLNTNEASTCRYMTSSGVAYASMTNTFTTTGGTTHSRVVSSLTNGTTYNYYVRCMDGTSNANTNDYTITFAVNATPVAQDTTPPIISNASPSGTFATGTTQATISVNTNEAATCKYATTPAVAYSAMVNTLTANGLMHSATISSLLSNQTYNYYVKCIDSVNNFNTNDFTISFNIAAPAPIEGDLNSDRIVNILDIQLLVNNFGRTSGIPAALDIASPGVIDLFDIIAVVRNWGRTN